MIPLEEGSGKPKIFRVPIRYRNHPNPWGILFRAPDCARIRVFPTWQEAITYLEL